MEVSPACGPNMMADELSRVRKLVMQLFESRTSPMEISGSVEQEILSSIDKAMAMATAVSKGFDGSRQLPACSPNAGGACTDSPRSASGSPRSDNSDRTFKDHENRDNCKKRKTQTKWTSQVRLGSGEGVEGPLDDGYSWRKYGQKDILGAKYPRGYYRCTHRNSQGCLAMKQVQRSDDNPSVFDVTYRGTHTCHRRTLPPRDQSQNQHQLLLSFHTGLKVKTEGLESESRDPAPPSFSFPSTTLGSMMSENHIFSSSSTLDSCFKGSFSPSFISPATSESNYFSVSPCRMSSYGGPKVHTSHEYDFTEIVSAETSATNSPMLDMDFLLEQVDLDPDFPFDSCSFFS